MYKGEKILAVRTIQAITRTSNEASKTGDNCGPAKMRPDKPIAHELPLRR